MFQEVAGGTYQLCLHGPIDEPKDTLPTRTTLNSMSAGLMEEKDLLRVKREYNKMHQTKPTPQPTKEKPKRGKPRLQVKVHGITVCTPQKRDIKCPVCKQVFNLVKDVNLHVKQAHPRFRYKCKYCTKKIQNYASRYKHERKHGTPNHMCKHCQKEFFFKKDLTVHSRVHTGQGQFRSTNCPNYYNTRAAMDTHRIVHQNNKYTCEKCPTFSTDTPANLHQHQRGKHGKGWKAPCGKRYDWPQRCLDIRRSAPVV